jgi:hypothetical protein
LEIAQVSRLIRAIISKQLDNQAGSPFSQGKIWMSLDFIWLCKEQRYTLFDATV